MNNNSIIKFLKFIEITAVVCIVLICAYVAVFTGNSGSRIIAIGEAAGAIIGGIIDIKVLMPKEYKNKDERTMVVKLLSQLFASTLCLMITLLFFTLTVLDAIELMKIREFGIFVLVIVLVLIVAEKLSYKVLNDKI